MTDVPWWKEAVFYQIYPRSFNDSDGDGVGDIPGIIERVDYLDSLGIDAVWLTPVYESPQVDHGYDIADYRAIHSEYGDMGDWEALRSALHDRDIRLVMDLVVNHTSDQHEWFQRSRAGEEPYADFYYWREGDGDEPPNNWESFFGGSAWTYDEKRGAYYLHLFDERQPDLNWHNPAVREAVYELMQWWFDRGIDGFRMDVIDLIAKPEGLPDGAPNDFHVGIEHIVDGPEIGTYLREMHDRAVPAEAVTVGEVLGVTPARAPAYVGPDGFGLSMLIHFNHVTVDWGSDGKWDPEPFDFGAFRSALTAWQEALDDSGWNCLYLENHDHPRSVSRVGSDEARYESATMLATMFFGLRGTPFIYQGQELGMTNTSFPSRDDIRDVEARNFIDEALAAGEYDNYDAVRPIVEARSRDNARTPMQWSAGPNAGFTDGEPWFAVDDSYETVNVDAQLGEGSSVLEYYRRLIRLRGEHDIFLRGGFEAGPRHESVIAYRRVSDDETMAVFCNFADAESSVKVPDSLAADAELLIGNYDAVPSPGTELSLRPFEARVYLDR